MYPQWFKQKLEKYLSFFFLIKKLSFLQPLKMAAYCIGMFALCRLTLVCLSLESSSIFEILDIELILSHI